MIRSFSHKGLENFFYKGIKKGIQSKYADRIADILDLIDAASEIRDINFPGSDLHPLLPKKDNIWVVKVSGAWRITFRFENGDAHVVDYLNYH
ncbi:type II toxin-antitoxin system RelE/ParE family toxin [Desulfonema magnum]|uniref:Toxin-antitoxin system, toxin component, mRNA interferase n=1 Tax=Desulfonema magnum TaxID=45655 RepID=A0A975GT79_9BACT|nr:type II toxin-antitoxin system RelE/ParE family toxin [Desulfonema magnum]QTA91843.1 Toxin-antitoxin system, toxin component, mRNA interferase [Desulfonema magnum]